MKRLLSLILAITMLISFIPVISAAETDESYEPAGIKITYDLAGYLNDATLGAEVTGVGFKTIDYTKSNGFFEFAASNYGNTAYSWLDNENTYLTEKPNAGFEIKTGGLQLVGKRTPWFALKINVPKRGLYTPKVNYVKYNKSYETYMEYYLIKATDDPVSTTLAEEGLTTLHSGYIGSKRCESDTGKQENIKDESFDDKTIPLEKGEYYLVYYPRDPESGSNAMAGNFTLDGGEKAVPMSIEISGEDVLDLDATVYLSDGTTTQNVTWNIKDEDKNTATIDSDGKITALADGTVEITATAELEGVSVSKAVNVTVTATPGSGESGDDDDDDVVLSDIKIIYDISSYVGTRNDESVPFSSLNYAKTHDFWEYAANRRSTYSWNSGRDNITTSGEDLNWIRDKGIAIRDRSNWWAIKINVPKSGYYKPKAYYGTYTNSGYNVYMNYYTLPVTASGVSVDLADSAFATGDNLIGSINCTDENVTSGTLAENPAEFKAKYFEKGEHYIVFYPSCTDEGKSGTLRGLVSDFILDGGEKAVPMSIEISGEDVLDLDATVYLSDGTTTENVTWNIKDEDKNTATIDSDGKITALSDGTVEITATAEHEGVSVSKAVNVTVTATPGSGESGDGGDTGEGGDTGDDDDDDVVLSDIKIIYDISSYVGTRNDESVPFSSLNYAKTHGFWEYAANRRSTYSWNSGRDNITTSGEDLNWVRGKGIAIRDRSNWWAIKIKVPESGYYKPKAYYGTYRNGGFRVDMNYYTLPVTASGASVDLADSAFATKENLIGSINCTNNDVEDVTMCDAPAEFKAKYFEKGEHYIVFYPSCTDEGKSGTLRGLVSDFILDGGEKAVPMSIEISGEDVLDLDATVYLSDGTTTENVTYRSENESVAEINENGIITAFEDAVVGITVTTENDGFSLAKTFNIEVKTPEIPGVSVTYDIASRVGTRNDPSVKFTDFTYESNNGLWEYAANRRARYSWAENGYDTITTSGEDLNYLLGKGIGIRVRSNWWAIKIKVPETGLYIPKMSYITYTNNGTVDGVSQQVNVYMQYYLIPVTEEVGEDGVIPELENSKFIGGEHLIGMINATDAENSLVKEGYLPKINIKKGEYYLVFNPVTDPALAGKTISGTMRAGAGNVTLDGINCIQELYVDAKTDIVWDEEAQISLSAIRLDGSAVTDYQVTYVSSNPEYVSVSKDGVIKGVAEGSSVITVTVSDGVGTITKELPVTVTDNTGAKDFLYNLTEKLYVNEKLLLDIDAVMNSGNVLDVGDECITYTCTPESVAKIEDGMITALREGEATVTATVSFRGLEKTFTNTVTVIPDAGKTGPTLYTNEMRENAQENIAKYDWAKTTQKNAIKAADAILPHVELIKNQIYGEGLPRTHQFGVRGDDYYQYCRYCHEIIDGDYEIVMNYTSRPWKVQCSACKRLFPSNDFESFLKLGLDESGRFFDVDRARKEHHEMLFHANGEECTCEAPTEEETPEWYIFYGYGNPKGYLYNELYPEIEKSNLDPWGDKITWNKDENGNDLGADLGTYKDDAGNVLWTGGSMWGVDDGWGYRPGRTYADGLEERIGYVAYYNHKFWMWMYAEIGSLADGYLYTNDAKYGRGGAILLDRVADVWNSFNMYYLRNMFFNVHGGSGYGAAVGRINDSYIARGLLNSTDKLYPMIEDDELIRTLAEDAEKSSLENDKKSSESVWRNWEEGIVLASYQMCTDGRINGNFGQPQGVAGLAAIVVGKQPETNEILNWIYATDTGNGKTVITGGNLNATLFNRVDRDGMGDEASPRYNTSWLTNLATFADATAMYTGEGDYQPYNMPKFIKMYTPQIDILLLDSKHPNIGDAGSVATVTLNGGTGAWLQAFERTDNEEYKKKIANYIYTVNGNKTTGYRYDIFTENPESAEEEIMKYVDPNQKTESTILTGYGIAILRDGAKYDSASALTEKNNMRDIWVTFGRTAAHDHNDALNLGMDAYGLDIAPDLGYPEATSYTPNRGQWVSQTISHNTVVVNEAGHDLDIPHGYPLHFDDTEMVKLIDVDESNRNSQTEKYRRSVVMIKANDDVSYAVDFFRVKGGNTHTYSFHSQAENAYPISGIELTPQVDENGNWIGTYAGVDGKDPETGEWIEYGPDPYTEDNYYYSTKYPRGYTWMDKIRRDKDPEQNITVEFDVQDYNKILKDGKGIKLRLTQMNNFTPDEVAIVAGYVPIKEETKKLPRRLDYLLVHNRGENLDSLFTTVLEPYKGERYVSDIKTADISIKTGDENSDDMARAVKVTHTSGRTDYVVYASNTGVTYTVSDTFVKADGTELPISFDFRGFVGVYTINENGACIYRYVNDGDIISNDGDVTGKTASYKGTVTGFQKENDFENYIDVEMQCDDLSDLEGRVIYVDNDRVENGAYRILSVSEEGEGLKEGSIRLDIGTVTLIRSLIDEVDFDKGYVYNIKEGQSFTIPTSFVDENLPEFEPVSDSLSTSVGSSISVTIHANSPADSEITYIAETLPRGAMLDASTGVLTWKPTSSQIGENHIAITARDADGRESTIHFNIDVYGSTTGASGGGTSSGSQTPGTQTPTIPATPGADKDDTPAPSAPSTEGDDKTDENVRFIDLGNHVWAADPINALADEGIIKGTSENTFSPAANITRADFAILLVRAFKLTSDDTTNFDDVLSSDYFASELAIARNTGIVNGIGDNKYAPRNTITRQDMMVIVYRALNSLPLEGKVSAELTDEVLQQYPDFDFVADYAKDAVKALITAGLVNGKSGKIAPTDYTTRAEVAVLLKRILDYIK